MHVAIVAGAGSELGRATAAEKLAAAGFTTVGVAELRAALADSPVRLFTPFLSM